MKNFRKVLALILVVATLFSFVAMASAKKAEEYTDYSEVKEVVAVDVITALGITEGYDGKFHPADTIDRDEVAAMIARLRNGAAFDATLYVGADNAFADVKGQWSEGYVTYCAQLGIINGLNATTFNPDGKVTVVEVAKLLLCVLGYDAQLQGYVGPNWKVAVIRDAEKMGLLAGIPATDTYKEATREQVAKMFLNAMSAELIYGYVSENIVTMTNSLLKTFAPMVPDLADAKTELAYNNAIVSDVTLGSILKVGYVDAQDCFGRPMVKWYAPNWSKFYPVAAAKVTTDGTSPYTAKETVPTKVYHNGQLEDGTLAELLGKGVIVERYADRVVVIDTFMAIVESTSNRYETMTLSNGDTLKNTLGAKAGDVVMYTLCDKAGTQDYVCGDKQVYGQNKCGDFYHDMSIVAPVEVKVEETHRVTNAPANSYIVTAEGKTYYSANLDVETYNIKPGFPADIDLDIMDWTAKGKNWWLYLDNNGYIQYWCAPAAAAKTFEVGYFVENTNAWTQGNSGTNNTAGVGAISYTADVVNMKAEKSNVAISAAIYEAMYDYYRVMPDGETPQKLGVFGAYGSAIEGGFQKAEVANIDSYLDATTGELVGEKAYRVYDEPNGKYIWVPYNEWFPLFGEWVEDTDTVSVPYHANADTQYLIRTLNFATGEYEYSTGLGYKAVAEYVGKVVMDNVDSTDLVAIPVIQYLDLNNDGIVDYLFVDAFYQKTTATYAHIIGIEENIGVASLGKFFPAFDLYNAYINGEKAYVAYYGIGGFEGAGRFLEAGKLYKTTMQAVNATYNGKPIYVALEQAQLVDLTTVYKFDQIKVENGQIGLYKDGELKERLASEYNADLVIYVKVGATVTTMTGVEFAAKYNNEYLTSFCYALEYPGVIKTLVVELY